MQVPGVSVDGTVAISTVVVMVLASWRQCAPRDRALYVRKKRDGLAEGDLDLRKAAGRSVAENRGG